MKTFDVTISRTEMITFRVRATDDADAAERYLADGEETDSDTTDTTVLSITEVSAE